VQFRHSFFITTPYFVKERSSRCGDIAIFAAAILDFQKFEILTVSPLYGANMHHRVKFHQNRSNSCREVGGVAQWSLAGELSLSCARPAADG